MSQSTPRPRTDARPDGQRDLRVLVADRSGSARRAISALIEDIDGVALVGQVETREEIGDALRRRNADVLVIDDRLLPTNGHPLAGAGPLHTDVRVLVVGMDEDPAFAARARRLGAEAWIAKHAADDGLRDLLGR